MRTRQTAYGRWQPYVDAQPVRDHINTLRAQGMGWKRVAEVANVEPSVLWKIPVSYTHLDVYQRQDWY